jgi:hypothetical protein
MAEPNQPIVRRQLLLEPSTWTVVLLILFGGALWLAIMADAPAIARLADAPYARGVTGSGSLTSTFAGWFSGLNGRLM